MNEHSGSNKDKMTDIEIQAITDMATKWGVTEKLAHEIMQYYTEKIENFERFLNERYPDDNMNTQPYVVLEINNKITRDIADKYSMDQDVVRMIIQDCTDMIRGSVEQEMLGELD
ncbi:hypothetical protein ACFLYL_04635 [Chloroflexota bacterium]